MVSGLTVLIMLTWLGSSGSGLSDNKNLEAVEFQWRPPLRTWACQGMLTLYLELLDLMSSFPSCFPSLVTRLGSKVTRDMTDGRVVSGGIFTELNSMLRFSVTGVATTLDTVRGLVPELMSSSSMVWGPLSEGTRPKSI